MSWEKITIKKYELILEALKRKSESRWITIASIIEDKTEEEVGSWDWVTQMVPYIERLSFLSTPATDLKKSFEIQGVKYQLIDLQSKLPTKRFVAGLEHKGSSWKHIAEKIAIVCYPVLDETYTYEKHLKLSDTFYEHMTMDIAHPLSSFFLLFYQALWMQTQESLAKEVIQTLQALQQEISFSDSTNTGNGL